MANFYLLFNLNFLNYFFYFEKLYRKLKLYFRRKLINFEKITKQHFVGHFTEFRKKGNIFDESFEKQGKAWTLKNEKNGNWKIEKKSL